MSEKFQFVWPGDPRLQSVKDAERERFRRNLYARLAAIKAKA